MAAPIRDPVRAVSRSGRAVLIDAGGVLLNDGLPPVAAAWAARLGCTPPSLLAAVFGGSDDQVLIGRTGEAQWWDVVARRLDLDGAAVAELRRDVESAGSWDERPLACLRGIRGMAATAAVANAWPYLRTRLAEDQIDGLFDEVILSCEVGYAKPAPQIFRLALERLGVAPADALLVDDVTENVDAAQRSGLAAHRHEEAASTMAAIERFVGRSAPLTSSAVAPPVPGAPTAGEM